MLTVPSLLLTVMVVAISSQDPASTSTSPDTSDSLAPITCYVCYNCLTYEQVQLRQCNATAGEHWCLVSGPSPYYSRLLINSPIKMFKVLTRNISDGVSAD